MTLWFPRTPIVFSLRRVFYDTVIEWIVSPKTTSTTSTTTETAAAKTTMAVMATVRSSCSFSLSVVLLLLFFISSKITTGYAFNNAVLSVKYKYAGLQRSISTLKAHDSQRQLSILAGVDLPLGGSGRPDAVGSLFSIYLYSHSFKIFELFY